MSVLPAGGCSTIQQLLRLTECVSSGLHRKWSTVPVFLDISKAYDSTWHTGLLYKLIQMRVPGELIKVIDSHLAHRSFRVKMERYPSGNRYKQECLRTIHIGHTEVYQIRMNCLCGQHLHLWPKQKSAVRTPGRAASSWWTRKLGINVARQHQWWEEEGCSLLKENQVAIALTQDSKR